MSAREDLINLAGYRYTPEKYVRKGQELYDRIAAEVRLSTLREIRKEAMALDKDPANDPYYWGYGGNEICKMIGAKVREARDGQ